MFNQKTSLTKGNIGLQEEPTSRWPLSAHQKRLWMFERFFPNTLVHNVGLLLGILGPIDVPILRASLGLLLQKHSVLRVAFQELDGEITQILAPIGGDLLEIHNLEGSSVTDRKTRLGDSIKEETGQALNVSSDPLFKATLFQLSPTESYLLLRSHRIILDRESESSVIRDLFALYELLKAENSPHSHSTTADPFFEFIKQEHARAAAVKDSSLNFWQSQLHDVDRSPELPLTRSRKSERSFQLNSIQRHLPPETLSRLREWSLDEHLPESRVLLAALACLLHRYTGLQKILIGTGASMRSDGDLAGSVGPFGAYLPLIVNLNEEMRFAEVVRAVSDFMELRDRQDCLPLETIASELNLAREEGRHPIVQILFHEINEDFAWQTSDLTIERLQNPVRFTEFDLLIQVNNRAGMNVIAEYSPELLEPEAVEALLGHLHTLLDGALRNPQQRVCELPLLSETEVRRIIHTWNQTKKDYDLSRPLNRLLENQVQQTPHAIALRFKEVSLTYEQVNDRANQLARFLQRKGVGPEALVGVCMERSTEMVISLLAIHKAGGAYVPLDPNYPLERLKFMLEDSGAKALLTESSLGDKWQGLALETVYLDLDWSEISQETSSNLTSEANSENLAYVIYTSGSTGKPKGVQVSHAALVNFVQSMREIPGICTKDRMLAVTTISFDIAGLEFFVPLATGATVAIADRLEAMDGNALADHLSKQDITIMQATPVTWQLLLESGWSGKSDLKVLVGGEALPRELAERLLEKCGSLWNMYGPTETTVWSTLSRVHRSCPTILIGKPIANTTTYILDPHLKPVPMGVVGELFIGGRGLSRGYLNRPELTTERFLTNPFDHGEKLYRTGDQARFHTDGSIECLGRADNQVKIRGFRIELGEIESCLLAHPAVSRAVVVASEVSAGNKKLLAYVVPAPGSAPESGELENFLKRRLPAHMIPADYIVMESLPLTPNGKVDRKMLPKPAATAHLKNAEELKPRTQTERELERIWARILGLHSVSISEDFFDLGGNSLLAMRLFAAIRHSLGVELSLNILLRAGTIEKLATQIDAREANRPKHQIVTIQDTGDAAPLFWIPGGRAISVLAFRETTLHLAEHVPAYGLESRLSQPGESLQTVEERAAEYVALVRQVQRKGPYRFAGFCTGGPVAYEMARQLHEQGETTSLLALVQASMPGACKGKLRKLRMKINRLSYLYGTFARFLAMRFMSKLVKVDRPALQGVYTRVAKLLQGWIGTSSQVADQTQIDSDSVVDKYVPVPFPIDIDVFVAEDCFESAGIPREIDPRLAWKNLRTGTVRVHTVAGDHYTMLTGLNAKQFADALRDALEQAQVTAQTPADTVK